MKKLTAALLCLFLLFGGSLAETATYGSVSFDTGAEYIDLGDQAVAEGDWSGFISFLRQFPNLKKVDMFATQVDQRAVNKLTEAFPELEFGWTLQLMKYKNKHIVRTDATYFSTRHGVCPNHSNDDFVLIGYCRDLLALDLGHNNLTDLSFLRNMPHLRVLILGENQKLKNIEPIGELKELEYLELFWCNIRDITPLTKLPRLMDLNLCLNNVKDWRPLKEMKQLRRLWVSGMLSGQWSEADRRELREALPDTEIVFVGQPDEKGWRYYDDLVKKKKPDNLVPHFAVIDAMMNADAYIPFAESAPLPGQEPADSDFLITEDLDPSELQ